MHYISVTYALVLQIKFATYYKFTKCKKLINCKTSKEISKIMVGGSIGYFINSKFYSLSFLHTQLEKIPTKEYLPF